MKAIRMILFSLFIAVICTAYGCQSMEPAKTAESQPMEAAMDEEKKAIAAMTKELDGVCDEIGALDKKAGMAGATAELNEKLMKLRREAYMTRLTIISGGIQEGREQMDVLKGQLKSLTQ